MHTRRVWNIADNFACIRIDDNDMRGVRHVQAAGGAVHRQIIPTALTANLDLLENFPACRRRKTWVAFSAPVMGVSSNLGVNTSFEMSISRLNRRAFLKCAAGASGGRMLAGCARRG